MQEPVGTPESSIQDQAGVHHESPKEELGHVILGLNLILEFSKEIRRFLSEEPPEIPFVAKSQASSFRRPGGSEAPGKAPWSKSRAIRVR